MWVALLLRFVTLENGFCVFTALSLWSLTQPVWIKAMQCKNIYFFKNRKFASWQIINYVTFFVFKYPVYLIKIKII